MSRVEAMIAALAPAVAEKSERDAWLALVRAVLAAAEVSRLPGAARHVVTTVAEHFGCNAGQRGSDGEGDGRDRDVDSIGDVGGVGSSGVVELAATLPRERLRALAVCLVGAVLCSDALRREAFLQAFGARDATYA